jgi:hypothetical protein
LRKEKLHINISELEATIKCIYLIDDYLKLCNAAKFHGKIVIHTDSSNAHSWLNIIVNTRNKINVKGIYKKTLLNRLEALDSFLNTTDYKNSIQISKVTSSEN